MSIGKNNVIEVFVSAPQTLPHATKERRSRPDEPSDHQNHCCPHHANYAVRGGARADPRAQARADEPAANPDATKLHALFDQEWQWTLREYPEFATGVGDDQFNDKLTDLSAPAIDSGKAH